MVGVLTSISIRNAKTFTIASDLGIATPAIEWSPDASYLAAACDQHTVCLYHQNGDRLGVYTGHSIGVASGHLADQFLCLLPDGLKG